MVESFQAKQPKGFQPWPECGEPPVQPIISLVTGRLYYPKDPALVYEQELKRVENNNKVKTTTSISTETISTTPNNSDPPQSIPNVEQQPKINGFEPMPDLCPLPKAIEQVPKTEEQNPKVEDTTSSTTETNSTKSNDSNPPQSIPNELQLMPDLCLIPEAKEQVPETKEQNPKVEDTTSSTTETISSTPNNSDPPQSIPTVEQQPKIHGFQPMPDLCPLPRASAIEKLYFASALANMEANKSTLI